MTDFLGKDFNKFMKQAMGGAGVGDRKNPSITGAGNIEGGTFDSLTIAGSGNVDGDVKAKTVEISGSGEIDGDLDAKRVEAAGSFNVSGSVKAADFESSGSCDISGDLEGGKILNAGALSVGGDVDVERFRSKGAFGIEGRLKAEKVQVYLGGDCSAKEIHGDEIGVKLAKDGGSASAVSSGGTKVTVKTSGKGRVNISSVATGGTQGTGGGIGIGVAEGGRIGGVSAASVSSSGGSGDKRLTVKTIEGDTVELVNTTADLVKGREVTIGKGCKIKKVEFSEKLDVAEGAKVEKQEKV